MNIESKAQQISLVVYQISGLYNLLLIDQMATKSGALSGNLCRTGFKT